MNLLRGALFSLIVTGVSRAAAPLSIERLNEIIESNHDGKPLIGALQIYPKAREYSIAITNRSPDGQTSTGTTKAFEKWVEGRYIISEPDSRSPETSFTMIVEYDGDQELYKKYIVAGGEIVGYSVGTRIGDTRSVSWTDLSPTKFERRWDNLTTETHTDESTTWISVTFVNGQLQNTEKGVATVTKAVGSE